MTDHWSWGLALDCNCILLALLGGEVVEAVGRRKRGGGIYLPRMKLESLEIGGFAGHCEVLDIWCLEEWIGNGLGIERAVQGTWTCC
jgi:hypothetical protein